MIDKIQVGSQVVWLSGYASWPNCDYRKVTVAKVLKTKFVTDDGREWNKNGDEYGYKGRRPARIIHSYIDRYALMTWAEADKREIEQAESRRQKRLTSEIDTAIGMFSFDLATLEEVAKLLAGHLANREGDARVDADYLTEHRMYTLAEYMGG